MLGDDLRWFITLAELEQVTAAADELHIAQPTLSRMLARLERRLNAELFDRRGKRIALNRFGRIYYERARRAQAELDAAQREIGDLIDPAQGTVALSFLHSFGVRLVPALIAQFRTQSPRVTFTLTQDAADAVTRRVTTGEADLAIVSPRPAGSTVAWRRLMLQRLALAVPATHRFADRRQIGLADAIDEPFIAMHPDFGMRRILEELCAAAHFRPRVTFESSELGTVAGLVSAGLGVAVLPVDDQPQLPPGLVLIPLVDAGATREIGVIWNPDRPLSRPVRAFRDFVEEWSTRPDQLRA
ncbi:LysR family transcriptional regulator [Antrihabitans cavernicola]|uniref:LysR family transcriptional regulator n=1 Tax=Antrihabitans cavernicola TaxID=2495913 RepID=A0A5A7SBN9_9NOCA|nr:LysR family transcriptional regulator [Spelaeibacter cavernicola]KAA0022974.1 LysR family transcriptional regulator [Spelaeibacter cavernicola]